VTCPFRIYRSSVRYDETVVQEREACRGTQMIHVIIMLPVHLNIMI